MMTPAEMDGVHAALVTADNDGDAKALAALCWQLYGELEKARRETGTLHARLSAVATVAGIVRQVRRGPDSYAC